ncbi:hypothetical protein [Clostridium perfringens]|uniref:Uncharacterized protein n=1 Tax=Clostridium perfringens TaxID=1502 RepID=A0ABD4PJN8_CLOPF|nr:hypothetical protein [Clostridium perfringens]MBO3337273.1 hypothetical protein [Clostridium perfringens]MBO3384555.1 hypothetical protein [Clostridium perfringens]MBO3396971.1 hypothetical protein [Clostridium perfringens]MBO3415250.1 hypothetical protein [Clostridium perfringens]MBO3418627.1 hypothetical protein [Clostridium perfringens]
MSNQISFFDKPKIKLLEDWTRRYPLVTKNSVHEVFIEKEDSYIVLIDKTFYGVYK